MQPFSKGSRHCLVASHAVHGTHRRTPSHQLERLQVPNLSFCKRRPQPRDLRDLPSCAPHASNAADRLLTSVKWLTVLEDGSAGPLYDEPQHPKTRPPRSWSCPRRCPYVAAPWLCCYAIDTVTCRDRHSSSAEALAACSAASAVRSRSWHGPSRQAECGDRRFAKLFGLVTPCASAARTDASAASSRS